jgi:hypothetical protein
MAQGFRIGAREGPGGLIAIAQIRLRYSCENDENRRCDNITGTVKLFLREAGSIVLEGPIR